MAAISYQVPKYRFRSKSATGVNAAAGATTLNAARATPVRHQRAASNLPV